MLRDETYAAYSHQTFMKRYAPIYAVVFYCRVRMHSRNAVGAVGSARLTYIHEYRICCNRSSRLVLVLQRCRRSGHVLDEIRLAAAVSARFRILAESEFLFC